MEQIYTIPVNEAFDLVGERQECGCPFCVLYRKLENDELDIILGASMMEPDIRIKTNEEGFCHTHFVKMLGRRRMLGMGLILESHLTSVKEKLRGKVLLGDRRAAAISSLTRLECDCYVCGRINKNLAAMTATAAYLFDTDPEFKKKLSRVPYFCIPHYRALIEYASKKLSKRSYHELYDAAYSVMEKYIDELSGDVSWFCKKFDYLYNDEPWYNSRDSVPRAVKFLTGEPDEENTKGAKNE